MQISNFPKKESKIIEFVTANFFQIFCNNTELYTKNEGFIRHVMTRGGYVNGLENKVQMDLQQRVHAHKNNTTNGYLVLVKD
jgi:hypothetical protein